MKSKAKNKIRSETLSNHFTCISFILSTSVIAAFVPKDPFSLGVGLAGAFAVAAATKAGSYFWLHTPDTSKGPE